MDAQRYLGKDVCHHALLSMLSASLAVGFAIAAFAGVFLLVGYVNIRGLVINRSLEVSTSVTPVAWAVMVTTLLAWKTEPKLG